MSTITLITGSTLGGAEYVADHVAELLTAQGHQTNIINQPQLEQLDQDSIWLIICSTHGAGDYPDNFVAFANALSEQKPTLEALKFAVIGLGDSNYDTFCAAGKNIEALLVQLGATAIGQRLDIDVSMTPVPEEPAEIWLEEWQNYLNG
ncbi:FMN-binding protein MioC [Photobacterium andalusiense]|uniref:Sulfite reductase [NADPH] flavoprotein alpha-component n=1 Tax=Photobacterium andalusiense TaxID=2204296 RepID=A0A1Y6MQ08_9GAMM|nr:FMN-binding protein MioC [Photobacterium andalusiense]SMY38654.1 Sulfite reductase [NADPH] flavoprotein alpha-component [Photobacterium andalusiense]